MTVHLRPLTDENRAELEALRLGPGQDRYVNTVTGALEEAEAEPGGRAIQWGLYDDDTAVGFVMVSDDVDGPGYIAQYLWKLLVDVDHQRRGYGTAALNLVADYFRDRPVDVMWWCAGRGEGSPIPFYERYGFVQTGELVFDGEVLLRLDL